MVQIFDYQGKTILKSTLISDLNNHVDLNHLANGVYLLNITDGQTSMIHGIIKK